MINLPLAHLEAKFIIDGQTYEVETFKIVFTKPIDYKGQPQHDVNGGQLMVTLSQNPGEELYSWAKTSTSLKEGSVLFQTDIGITILRIEFSNAYCITLKRSTNILTGTKTVLVIAPEKVKLNGREHNNFWAK